MLKIILMRHYMFLQRFNEAECIIDTPKICGETKYFINYIKNF